MSWNTIKIEIAGAERSQVLLWQLLLLTSWLYYMTNWIPGWQYALWPCSRPLPSGSDHTRLAESMQTILHLVNDTIRTNVNIVQQGIMQYQIYANKVTLYSNKKTLGGGLHPHLIYTLVYRVAEIWDHHAFEWQKSTRRPHSVNSQKYAEVYKNPSINATAYPWGRHLCSNPFMYMKCSGSV